jgi:PAS domain S-box-containing protein
LPSGDAARLVGHTGPDQLSIGSVERLESDSLLAAAARARHPVVVSDWQAETRLKLTAPLRDAGISSSASVAISMGCSERIYGFLTIHSREPRSFPDVGIRFLKTSGSLLAYALASARSALSFGALVEDAPDLIVWFDNDLRIRYVNPAAERMTGSSAESLTGRTSHELGVPDSLVSTWELVLLQAWRSGQGQAFVLTMRTPAGERVFESRVVPVPGLDGSVQSLLTVSHDVTGQQHHSPVVATEYLNYRERHILRLIAAGFTNREIGVEIGLAIGTVKNHVATILSKLNVTDRTQAAVRGVEIGLVQETGEPGEQ